MNPLRLFGVVAGGDPEPDPDPDCVVCECRRCGTSLEPGADACTHCGSCDVVRYEF